MTIAVVVKVHDGLVIAADSASTLIQTGPNGQQAVLNVYDNANKIVNLLKGSPLGAITWGTGSIGNVSVTTVLKDIRQLFAGEAESPDGCSWKLDPKSFQVSLVADRVRRYIVDHVYEALEEPRQPLDMGLVVVGYSSGGRQAEAYQIDVDGGTCGPPVATLTDGAGITVGGMPQSIARLIFGVDPAMGAVLRDHLGVPNENVAPALEIMQRELQAPVLFDAMPIQDALDLAEFLVDVTIKMVKFMPGAGTVGGPIELAAVTKHEGFRWVKRKHYFSSSLNPSY